MTGGPGYWQLWQGSDLHANGDWCRVAYSKSVGSVPCYPFAICDLTSMPSGADMTRLLFLF
jgi:hypothetical protein